MVLGQWRGVLTRRSSVGVPIAALVLGLIPATMAAQEAGRIEGRILRSDGSGVVGATAVLNETAATVTTGGNGEFLFLNVPPGTYSVSVVLGQNVISVPGLRVSAGETTPAQETVDWDAGLTDELTVIGSTRQVGRIVDAPAAASVVSAAEIERKAAHGQLPKLIEYTPGAQLTQGDVGDYNFGTRGFNRALSQRMAVILDGRDMAVPVLGSQYWANVSFPLDDLSSVEVVRGPSAALYGANAPGGVMNLTTKEPRFNLGGMARVSFGELGTANLDTRWSGELGNGWYTRVVAGRRDHDLFAVSRVDGPEYSAACEGGAFTDCLSLETVPIESHFEMFYGGARFDRYLDNGVLLTMEGGYAEEEGGIYQIGGDRVQTQGRASRPWTRFNVNGDRFNVSASYDTWDAPSGYKGLTSATDFFIDSSRLQVEGQTNWSLRQDSVEVVVGGAISVDKSSSEDPATGAETWLTRAVTLDKQAVYGQGAWTLTEQVRVVLAGRGDWGALHDFQLSPKASLIYSVVPDQSVRFTYNRAFLAPNIAQIFLQFPAVPAPADLSGFNALCTPFGVDCGFGITPILALGNEGLDVETIQTWEVGYQGVLAGRAFLTLDYYRSYSQDTVTSLLPQLGTALGRVNPRFGPWEAPAGLPDATADLIRGIVPILSNNTDGSNILAAASLTNFGPIDGQGIDFGLNYFFRGGWRSAFTYSWFDYEIQNQLPGGEDLLLPNTPTHAFSLGLAFDQARFGGSIDLRWVDDFRWSNGFVLGDVPSYTTVDATVLYPLSDQVSLGLNVTNLFDNDHWESFGGSILRRRALLSLQYDW